MYRLSLVFLLCLSPPIVAEDSLWKMLATQPHLVVIMRHATAQKGDASAWDETGRCQNERMLTEGGKLLAKKIGEAFRSRGIVPVVLSSPQCRARHTAEIAFGKSSTDAALREPGNKTSSSNQAFVDKAHSILRQYRGKVPIVLINHKPNIEAITLETVETGELIIGKIGESGTLNIIGKIRISSE